MLGNYNYWYVVERVNHRTFFVIGGTETGHAGSSNPSARTHSNGWKLDIRKRGNDCPTQYITKTFTKISHSVEKRNARERTRVHTVNQAFTILKTKLPTLRANTKRVSKLKILRTAIEYIGALRNMIKQDDQTGLVAFNLNLSTDLKNPKLNEELQRLSSEGMLKLF